MTSITTSGILRQDPTSLAFFYNDVLIQELPLTITADDITVTLGSNISIVDDNFYIRIDVDITGTVIDGNFFKIFYNITTTLNLYYILINILTSSDTGLRCDILNLSLLNQVNSGTLQIILTSSSGVGSIINNCCLETTTSYGALVSGTFTGDEISNSYVFVNNDFINNEQQPPLGGGICTTLGSASVTSSQIRNCYVIITGTASTSAICGTLYGTISNSYVVVDTVDMGIRFGLFASVASSGSSIGNCYLICNTITSGVGIAGTTGLTTGQMTISNCYVVTRSADYPPSVAICPANTIVPTNCSPDTGQRTQSSWGTGSNVLNTNVFKNYNPTEPWLLSSFNRTIVVSGLNITERPSGFIPLNEYAQELFNSDTSGGIVFSINDQLTASSEFNFLKDVVSDTAHLFYSEINNGQYTLGLLVHGNSESVAGYDMYYNYSITNNVILLFPTNPPCFKEDSKILTDKGYIAVQDLREGQLVKTLTKGFLPIYKIGKRVISHLGVDRKIKEQLYRCSKDKYPELFEDLILTGCHSLLVQDFENKEQEDAAIAILGEIYETEGKLRLPACADDKSIIYEEMGDFMIYHFALENEHYYGNYGVFANGLLVESCTKNYIDNHSNMEII